MEPILWNQYNILNILINEQSAFGRTSDSLFTDNAIRQSLNRRLTTLKLFAGRNGGLDSKL